MDKLQEISSFVNDVRQIISAARAESADAINQAMLKAYWLIGKRIVEEDQGGSLRAEYGSRILRAISQELTHELGKGFNERNLAYYRKFYLDFPNGEILHTRVQNLTWSHIRALLRVDNPEARSWYMKEASEQMWSVRTLDRNISTQYYFRLLSSHAKDKVKTEMEERTSDASFLRLTPTQFIKSPVVTEFLGLGKDTDFTESDLEKSLITHLQQFLLELGKGYAFVERQQHVVTDTDDYYIDLVFYNYLMRCFVLIDLKTSKLTHQDVGQMDMYVRMYDELKRNEGDNPTIGILLCAETSKDIARYSVLNGSSQLFASKYMTYLPSEEDLLREIDRQKEFYLLQKKK